MWGCWRVSGGWCGDLSNVNEAGLPGWGPASCGACALVLLVRSAVVDRPCSIVLESQGDDLASLDGLKRSVRVGAQVVDVAQPAIWVGFRLRCVGVRVCDRHARVGLIGQEGQELALASFQVGRRRVVVRSLGCLVDARADVCVRVGLVARGIPDIARDDVGSGDGLGIGAVDLARIWQ